MQIHKNRTLPFLGFLGAVTFGAASCTKAPDSGPPSENIFRYAISAKIPSLDPHETNDVYSSLVQALVYESLYQYHYLKRPYELAPALAEALPVVSKDRKTFTFKLKKGIRFQDDACVNRRDAGPGREVTADDLIYMFERVAAPKSTSPLFGSLEGRVVGIDAFHSGKAKSISGIRALDPYTVELKLTRALPRFVYNLVNTHAAIVPRECVEKLKDEFARHAVGTGPFSIVEFNGSHKVVAVKNPNYRVMTYPTEGKPGDQEAGLLVDTGKPLPLVDKVVVEVIVEDQPTWLKFRSGETEMSRIPKDNFAAAIPGGKLSPELVKRGVKHFRHPKNDVTTLIFNMEDPVWGKKKELRQAVALALDVEKIIEVQYSGQAIRAHSVIDPSQYGYDSAYKSRWAERDVAKAKELLAKAGYPGGKGLPPLVQMTTSGTTARQLDELMARQLAEAGITLQADVMTWPELDRKLRDKRFMSVGIGWASDVPDADSAIGMFHSRLIKNGVNAPVYRNAEVDRLVDEIEEMDNGPARLAKIRRVQDVLDDELPLIVMVHRIGNQLIQPWVKNHVYLDEMFLGPFLKYHRVEPGQAHANR